MPNKSIINTAIVTAKKSKYVFRVGAVLYKGGAVVKTAYNDEKYVRWNKYSNYPSNHAEIKAIKNLKKKEISTLSLLVVRVKKNDELTCAKPCKSCILNLLDHGIKEVFYSTYEGTIEKLNLSNLTVEDYRKDTNAKNKERTSS